jgi:RNA polymerase I-specific transcription initiation factor RRN7
MVVRTKMKKEKRVQPKKLVSGDELREAFVSCLQVVLRAQIEWLNKKLEPSVPGYSPSKFEKVARLLWDWRLRKVTGIKPVAEDRPRKKRKRQGNEDALHDGSDDDADGDRPKDVAMFSSLGDDAHYFMDDITDAQMDLLFTKKKKWWSKEVWPIPGVIDTLAVTYVTSLMLRLPVRVGDIFRWARSDRLPYLHVVSQTYIFMGNTGTDSYILSS